jgi:hypothetical protein
MKFHQFEGQECEGAGWAITNYSVDSEPTLRPPTVEGASMPTVGYGFGDRREGRRRDVEIGRVIGVAVTLVLTVALAGVYAGFRLAAGEPTANAPTNQAADVSSVNPGVDLTTMRVGECVKDASGSEKWASELVEPIECSAPHAEEVFGKFRLHGRYFPGDRRASELAWRACDKLFEQYVGIPPDDSRLESFITYPSKETWVDSRVVVCTAAGAGDTLTTGSVRNTRR